MAKDMDLLPWILGGMLAVGAALASGFGGAAAPSPPTPPVAPGSAAPAAVAPQREASARASSVSAADAELTPVAVSPNARTQLPPGQVWECVIDGQRVFSDTQCGTHASVRQLSELNVMPSSAPPPGYYRPPAYYPPPSQATDDSAPYPSDDDVGYGTGVIVVHERARRDRVPRHDNHPHGRAARP